MALDDAIELGKMALDDAIELGKIKRGDLVVIISPGLGYSQAAAAVRLTV
jgi:3-oxoacyl-[acyl-carrier-protein] synthase III